MLKWCENDSKYGNVKTLGDRWGILVVIHCCVVNLWQGLSEEAKCDCCKFVDVKSYKISNFVSIQKQLLFTLD